MQTTLGNNKALLKSLLVAINAAEKADMPKIAKKLLDIVEGPFANDIGKPGQYDDVFNEAGWDGQGLRLVWRDGKPKNGKFEVTEVD